MIESQNTTNKLFFLSLTLMESKPVIGKKFWQTRICDAFPNVTMCGKPPRGNKALFQLFDLGPNNARPFMIPVHDRAGKQEWADPNARTEYKYTREIAKHMKLGGANERNNNNDNNGDNNNGDDPKSVVSFAMFHHTLCNHITFLGTMTHSTYREPVFTPANQPVFPDLLPGMCLPKLTVVNPEDLKLHPGVCLFVSGCTGKSRGNTFVCLVKDGKLILVMEPEDLRQF